MFFHQTLGGRHRKILLPTRIRGEALPCQFLKIPLEIRNQIYGYMLPSSPISTSHTLTSFFTTAREFPAILLTSRQIYSEAVEILYHQSFWNCTILCPPYRISFGEQTLPRRTIIFSRTLTGWRKESLARMQRIELNIDWLKHAAESYTSALQPSLTWNENATTSETLDWDNFLGRIWDSQATVDNICDVFCELHQLRNINISWSQYLSEKFASSAGSEKYALGVLLRPLIKVRRNRPGLIINMPLHSPLSTAELAEQHKESSSQGTRAVEEYPETGSQESKNQGIKSTIM